MMARALCSAGCAPAWEPDVLGTLLRAAGLGAYLGLTLAAIVGLLRACGVIA